MIDTAPTGHTLLLLDTAGAYHRQLTQQAAGGPARIRTALMFLQDPEYTKVLIVTLPETTPVLEASALQDDLRRAQIEPFAWVINGSLAAAHPKDPVLRARASAEVSQIRKVKQELARRVALIPFQLVEPVGIERLGALGNIAGYRRRTAADEQFDRLRSPLRVVCAEDCKSNFEALFAALRILSAYWTNRGVTPIRSKYRR